MFRYIFFLLTSFVKLATYLPNVKRKRFFLYSYRRRRCDAPAALPSKPDSSYTTLLFFTKKRRSMIWLFLKRWQQKNKQLYALRTKPVSNSFASVPFVYTRSIILVPNPSLCLTNISHSVQAPNNILLETKLYFPYFFSPYKQTGFQFAS